MANPETKFIIELLIASGIVTLCVSLVIYFSGITRLFERRKAFIGRWIGGVIDAKTKERKGGFFQVVEVYKVTALTDVIPVTKSGKKTTIVFDSSKPTFRTKKNTWIYIVDIDKGQVLLNPQEFRVPNYIYDDILTRGGLRNTLAGIGKTSLSGMLIYIVIGAIMALPAGLLIGSFLM